eukprot:TRINITY_DN12055_c0_g1_i1.p1 TRINITY_DN12055_c0_g1~~TRINITY_DN12055_c0_g1_i1.p1  ORF type:complete len:123 (+),score=3.73 TRINITY_DN12055_c0_g1_i1:285-653(+)
MQAKNQQLPPMPRCVLVSNSKLTDTQSIRSLTPIYLREEGKKTFRSISRMEIPRANRFPSLLNRRIKGDLSGTVNFERRRTELTYEKVRAAVASMPPIKINRKNVRNSKNMFISYKLPYISH